MAIVLQMKTDAIKEKAYVINLIKFMLKLFILFFLSNLWVDFTKFYTAITLYYQLYCFSVSFLANFYFDKIIRIQAEFDIFFRIDKQNLYCHAFFFAFN